MKKFDYNVYEVVAPLSGEKLNELGEKGWELVSLIYSPPYSKYMYIFKREYTSR